MIQSFQELIRDSDAAINVTFAAALLAKDIYADLDVAALLAQFDDLAGPLRDGALADLGVTEQAEAVSARFRELGFRGNVDDYYDPKNSLLPDVLERRIGIPITLSVVWCELAQRAGVFAHGVGFPGHFLARVDESPRRRPHAPAAIVDPFNGGKIVGEGEARELLRRTRGPNAELQPGFFARATPVEILIRMLTNLKAIWMQRNDNLRAFIALDRIVELAPDSTEARRERDAVARTFGVGKSAPN